MTAREMDISKKRQRAGRLGGRKQSERKTTAVRANGRLGGLKGGQSKSEAKAAASRANGRLRLTNTARASAEAQVLNEIFGAGSIQP
jgi:hypothetical protein